MQPGTIPDIKTTNKDRILQLYLELNELSAILLNQIRTNAVGDVYFTFSDFRKNMFELYYASCRYDRFSDVLKGRLLSWMNMNVSGRPSKKMINRSIKIYNELVDELIRVEVLEL